MSTLSPAMQLAAAAGCAIILWTVVLTARKYPALPARMAYPKNYGDGGEQRMPKPFAAWLIPAVQIGETCIVAWGVSQRLANAPGTHGDPLGALIVANGVLLILYFVQRNVMLRPDV